MNAVVLELFRTYVKIASPQSNPDHWDNTDFLLMLWNNLTPRDREAWVAVANASMAMGSIH